jgi:hypothetical protein
VEGEYIEKQTGPDRMDFNMGKVARGKNMISTGTGSLISINAAAAALGVFPEPRPLSRRRVKRFNSAGECSSGVERSLL